MDQQALYADSLTSWWPDADADVEADAQTEAEADAESESDSEWGDGHDVTKVTQLGLLRSTEPTFGACKSKHEMWLKHFMQSHCFTNIQHSTSNIQQATDKQMGWSFVKSFDCSRWELKIPAEYFLYFNTLSHPSPSLYICLCLSLSRSRSLSPSRTHSGTGRLIVDWWPLRTYKRIRTKIDGSDFYTMSFYNGLNFLIHSHYWKALEDGVEILHNCKLHDLMR